jgi:hypothetical protein
MAPPVVSVMVSRACSPAFHFHRTDHDSVEQRPERIASCERRQTHSGWWLARVCNQYDDAAAVLSALSALRREVRRRRSMCRHPANSAHRGLQAPTLSEKYGGSCVTFHRAKTDKRSPGRKTWRMKCAAASARAYFLVRAQARIVINAIQWLLCLRFKYLDLLKHALLVKLCLIGKSGAGRLWSSERCQNADQIHLYLNLVALRVGVFGKVIG